MTESKLIPSKTKDEHIKDAQASLKALGALYGTLRYENPEHAEFLKLHLRDIKRALAAAYPTNMF